MTEKELFRVVGIRTEATAPVQKKQRDREFPWISVILLAAIVLCCLLAELLMTKDPAYLDLKNYNVAPNGDFLFGTDSLGREQTFIEDGVMEKGYLKREAMTAPVVWD